MAEVGIDIEADAMEAYPALHPDADGGDLVLAALALVPPAHPDADPVLPALAADVEGRERADQPFLQVGHEPAHVAAAPLQVKHHVGDALARSVISELAAAAGGPINVGIRLSHASIAAATVAASSVAPLLYPHCRFVTCCALP